jgi:hypothetical protein
MMPADIDSEFEAARARLPDFADRIRPRVSAAIWHAPAPLLGVLAADFDSHGGWEPFAHADQCSGGVLSLLIACRADDEDDDDITAPVPRWPSLHGAALIDIVAMPLTAPHRWARRTGLARTLGRLPFMEPRAVTRVYRSPARWLLGDGGGIVILEHERGMVASIVRACSGGIEADDADHARALNDIRSRPVRFPAIRAASSAMRSATK